MPLTLRTMLCQTRDGVHILRKDLYKRGYALPMHDIDTMLGIVEEDAEKAIRSIDASAHRDKPL